MTRQGPLKPQHAARGAKPSRAHPGRRGEGRRAEIDRDDGPHWLWGVHAVMAALANPGRTIERVIASRNAAGRLPPGLAHEVLELEAMDHLLPPGAVHQGLAVRVAFLDDSTLEDAVLPIDHRPVVVVDQVSDPQNVGAIFRAAAAFGGRAVILQDRKSPPLTGVAAKAAAGALELVAPVRVVNIARSVEALADAGYLTIGLEGEAEMALADAMADPRPVALVVGAEGKGLRDLVAATAERRARIPMDARVESLNVAAACAVALYEAYRTRPAPG